MDQQRIDMYFMSNQKFFPEERILFLKDKLRSIDDEKFSFVTSMELMDPTTYTLVAIFLGGLGVDRFMLDDTAMGVLKLLTGGCCGVLTLIDALGASKKAKNRNFQKLMSSL